MGAYVRRDGAGIAADLERVCEHFPVLGERRRQAAGTLSGGEQQMLAIGRALMARPRLILFDEPSLGLAPTVVETTFAIIADIRRQGTTVLMVEQNALPGAPDGRSGLRAGDRAASCWRAPPPTSWPTTTSAARIWAGDAPEAATSRTP